VNNKLENKCEGIQDLQKMIAKTINEHRTFKETYPVAWLKVLDDILVRPEITMSIHDFEKEITSKYGIRGDMIGGLCEVFHELGMSCLF
jgi:hypothetical protein